MDVNVNLSFLYVIVCFLIIFFVARKTLFTKLDGILAERHEMIEGAQEKAAGDEEYIEGKLTEVNEKLAEARGDAFKQRQGMREEALETQSGIVAEAREKAAAQIATAQAELDTAVSDARAQLERESEALAKDIADRVLGGTA